MAKTPEDRPETATGTELSVVDSFPSWPFTLYPQHWTPPALVRAQVSMPLVATAVSFTQAASQQKSPATQSLSPVHVVLHAVEPHV